MLDLVRKEPFFGLLGKADVLLEVAAVGLWRMDLALAFHEALE